MIVVLALASAVLPSRAEGVPAPAQAPTKLVRIGFPEYDGTLTPYTFTLGYPLVTLIYDTLLWRDAQGIPRPWLARSVRSSDGGRRLTVALRAGVHWQDGKPLTATDVAFTFGFMASHYQPRFTPELTDVAAVRATGPLTVVIDLRHISLGFEDQPLADMPILPEHLWRNLPPGRNAPPGLPVGSGPYRLVSAQPHTGYVFRANRSYFEGQPRVEEIRVPIIGQVQALYEALRQRRVDMLPLSLPAADAASLGSTLGIKLQSGPSYSGTALLLNLTSSPFDRLAARRAVADAINLEQIVSSVQSAIPADQGYIHPASPWSSGVSLHHFDLAAARSMFTTLGTSPIRVLAPDNDPVRLQAGQEIVQELVRAGARATLVKVSSAKLERAIGETGKRPAFEAAIESTPPLASYDPDFLARVFGSDPHIAPLNFGGYRSAAFDALAARVASAPDLRARREATRAELSLLATDLPAIPLFFSEGTFAYLPADYSGWVFIKGTGILDKRSFLPGPPVRGRASGSVTVPRVPRGSSSGGGISLVNVLSIVVLALVVILAALGLRSRHLSRR